jgi:hypothetical protein
MRNASILRNGPAVLFAAAVLAFLLPFGTVSCEGETVSFTGLELATMRVPADPDAAPRRDGGLAADVEAEGGPYALLALVLAAGGLVSAVVRARGGGFAFGAALPLLVLLFNVAESEPDVDARAGYWLALGSVAGAGALRRVAREKRRQEVVSSTPHGSRWRRLDRPIVYALAGLGILVIGSAWAPPA